MLELTGNLWNYHAVGIPICITTTGSIPRDGACAMGRGIAKQAVDKFPRLPVMVGNLIKRYGLGVHYLQEYKLFIFPVKYVWSEPAGLELIESSAHALLGLVDAMPTLQTVALPRPG